jgi:hypothetical protein
MDGQLVPAERIELPTFGLQNRCTTAVLRRRDHRCRQSFSAVDGSPASRAASGAASTVRRSRHLRSVGPLEHLADSRSLRWLRICAGRLEREGLKRCLSKIDRPPKRGSAAPRARRWSNSRAINSRPKGDRRAVDPDRRSGQPLRLRNTATPPASRAAWPTREKNNRRQALSGASGR